MNATRPTGLQAVLDSTIAKLVALRGEHPCNDHALFEDHPQSLRDLAGLARDGARIFDGFFHEIAFQGGLSSRSGASPHANLVTCAIDGDLPFELIERAEELEADEDSRAVIDRREHGTLDLRTQGIGQ